MKKIILLTLSLGLMLGLASCASKVKVDLSSVTFASLYLGSSTEPFENELTGLNVGSSDLIKSAVELANWKEVNPNIETLEPVGVILIDTEKRSYEFYQSVGNIVIRVTQKGFTKIYYQVIGSMNTLIEETLKPIDQAIKAKKELLTVVFIKADSNSLLNSAYTRFDLSTENAASLTTKLKTEDWVPLLPSEYPEEPVFGFEVTTGDASIKLMFLLIEDEAILAYFSENNETSSLIYYSIPMNTYNEVRLSLNWWRSLTYPIPDEELTKVIFTEVKITTVYIPESVLKSEFFPITKEESSAIKPMLNIESWVKLNTKPDIKSILFSFKDQAGYVITIGYSDSDLLAQFTHPADSTYLVTYLIDCEWVKVGFALLPFWEEAKAPSWMNDVGPVSASVLNHLDTDEGVAGVYDQYNLTTAESAKIQSLMNVDLWRMDPRGYLGEYMVFAYTYGLTDQEGNRYEFWSFEEVTGINYYRIGDETINPIWFIAPESVITNLRIYMDSHYPKP